MADLFSDQELPAASAPEAPAANAPLADRLRPRSLDDVVGQKHLTLWGYVADPLIFVVNKNVWASWSPEDQKAVREAAQQAAREEIARARAGISPGDDATLKEIEGNGVSIVRLSDAERDAFRKATASVYKEWAGKVGKDLVQQAEEDVAKR